MTRDLWQPQVGFNSTCGFDAIMMEIYGDNDGLVEGSKMNNGDDIPPLDESEQWSEDGTEYKIRIDRSDVYDLVNKAIMSEMVDQAKAGWNLEWKSSGTSLTFRTVSPEGSPLRFMVCIDTDHRPGCDTFDGALVLQMPGCEYVVGRVYGPTIKACANRLFWLVRELLEEALARLEGE
jgi:hypothetical protein